MTGMYEVLGGKMLSSTMNLVFRFGIPPEIFSFLFRFSWGVWF